MTLTPSLYIDWTQSGSFGTNEGGRMRSLVIRRGRRGLLYGGNYLTEGISDYKTVDAGYFSCELANNDRRFDPYNTASALYDDIKTNRKIICLVDTGSAVYNIFRGWIRDIQPQKYDATIEANDGQDWLASMAAPDLDLQTGYDVADAMAALLDGSSWNYTANTGWKFTTQLGITSVFGEAAIDDDNDSLPYWWSQSDKTVWANLQELAKAYSGDVFISADGTVCYRSRRQTSTSVLTITDDEIYKDARQVQPWAEIRNIIRMTAWPRQETDANTDLWQLNDIPQIAAGATLTIWADYQYQSVACPASSITTPASTTDYTANVQADGGGADKTAQISIVMTDYATRAKLEITNNDAGAVYLTLMKLRGTGIYSFSGTAVEKTSATSQTEYDPHLFAISSPWIQTTDAAEAVGTFVLDELSGPRRGFILQLKNQPAVQFGVDLFSQVTLDSDTYSVPGLAYLITHITHEWTVGGTIVTTWYLEPAYTSWIFTVQLGQTSFFGG